MKVDKTDKLLDLARDPKKFWTTNVSVIQFVVGALRIVFKNLEIRLNEESKKKTDKYLDLSKELK